MRLFISISPFLLIVTSFWFTFLFRKKFVQCVHLFKMFVWMQVVMKKPQNIVEIHFDKATFKLSHLCGEIIRFYILKICKDCDCNCNIAVFTTSCMLKCDTSIVQASSFFVVFHFENPWKSSIKSENTIYQGIKIEKVFLWTFTFNLKPKIILWIKRNKNK